METNPNRIEWQLDFAQRALDAGQHVFWEGKIMPAEILLSWLHLHSARLEWRDKSDYKWRRAIYPEIVNFSFHVACDGNVSDQEIASMLGADRFRWLPQETE